MMETCIQYNDLGIAYYKNGDMPHAVLAFKEALAITKKIICEEGITGTTGGESDTQASRPFVSQNAMLQDDTKTLGSAVCEGMEDVDIPWLSPRHLQSRTRHESYVFGRGLRIPPGSTAADIGVACMFNLALVYHRHGFEKSSSQDLNKAAKAYGLAHSLLTSEDSGSPLTLAAIVNNLGHVNQLLGNKELSEQCFQYLLMALMYVSSGSSVRMNEELQERFFSNVMYLVLDDKGFAPAA